MANFITFLKNYNNFGWEVRAKTSKIYLKELKISKDEQIRKIMMLRITEELISSTEDLVMWIMALERRNNLGEKYRDIWEFLLDCEADDLKIVTTLKEISRIKTPQGLIRRFKLPSIIKLSEYLKTDKDTVSKFLKNLNNAVKASLKNRIISRRVLVRFHNKVKHGMLVQDYGNSLYIRETRFEKRKKGIYRRNRNLYLPVDSEKAEKMVSSIESNSYAIRTITWFFMSDFIYNDLLKRKRKLGRRQILFLQEILKSN